MASNRLKGVKYPGSKDASEEMFEIDLNMSPMPEKEAPKEMLAQGEGEEQDSEIPEVNQAVPQALMDFLKENNMGASELKAAIAQLEEEPEEVDILS